MINPTEILRDTNANASSLPSRHPITNASPIPTVSAPVQAQGSTSNLSAGPSVSPATSLEHIFRTRGDDRAQSGDYNGAVVMYDEALSYSPTDLTLLLSRSFAHTMTTPPRLDLALKDADAAIQYSPTNWQAWLQQGETRLKLGDLQGAEDALVNALRFAEGINKVTAQRSLADVRARRAMPPLAAEQRPSSVPSTSPAASPSSELPIRTPLSVSDPQAIHTQPTSQTSSTTSPATADSRHTPRATSIPQPSQAPSAPTRRPASTIQVPSTSTLSPTRTASSSITPAASNTQSTPARSSSFSSTQSKSTAGAPSTRQSPKTPTPNSPRSTPGPASAAASSSQPSSKLTSLGSPTYFMS